MHSDELPPSHPVFKTPNPEELQSEEGQAAIRAKINEEQVAEDGDLDTDVIRDVNEKLNMDDAESQLSHSDDLSKRQIGPLNRTGG